MQKGNAAPLLLLLGLIIAGIVIFYPKGSATSLKTSSIPSIVSSPAYTNQNLRLEFSYPNNLKVQEDTEEAFNQRGNGNFRKNFASFVGYEPGKFLGAVIALDKENNFDTNPFTVWVFDNPQNLTIDAWYKNYWYYPFVWGDFTYKGKFELAPKNEATISGQMAKSGIIDYSPGKPKFVYVSKDGKMYLFRIIGEKGEKILSSVKLL